MKCTINLSVRHDTFTPFREQPNMHRKLPICHKHSETNGTFKTLEKIDPFSVPLGGLPMQRGFNIGHTAICSDQDHCPCSVMMVRKMI